MTATKSREAGKHVNRNTAQWHTTPFFIITRGRQSHVGVYSNVSFEMQSGVGIGAVTTTLASWGYSSQHPGGALFAMSDGAVKFVAETIESRIGNLNDPTTWGTYQKLGVRNDGHVVGDF